MHAVTTALPARRRTLTLAEALRAAAGYLSERAVPEARGLAECLVSGVLDCGRLELGLRLDEPLDPRTRDRIEAGFVRLGEGEPLQYVLGWTEFQGRRFKTDRRVLIPRPETELLVEAVLESELGALPPARAGPGNAVVADVGTGGGCIAVTLALERPGWVIRASDRSAEALRLARENAEAHGVRGRIRFLQADLLAGTAPANMDAVAANLPYVRTGDWAELPCHIREHEPRLALDGGPAGLDVIRRLIPQAAEALKRGGGLFLEIGYDQGETVTGLLLEAGFVDVRIRKDAASHDRVACATKPEPGIRG